MLLLFPRFLYLSFLFLSLFDFVVLLSLASLFITALALSGQSEKAAIFCKGCYAALHGHRSRYNFMFFVHLKYLERLDTLWLLACSLVTRLLVTMCARSKSIGAVDYSQFPASSSDSKCRGCEAKVCLPDPDQITSKDHTHVEFVNFYKNKIPILLNFTRAKNILHKLQVVPEKTLL